MNYFSVILCVNKDHGFLDAAIDSILEQSYRNFEFLIAANNCDDALYCKLKHYELLDCRVNVERTNIGQLSFNLNYLINKAKGEFLVRMDADDISYKNRLDEINKFITETNSVFDVIGSCFNVIDESGRYIYSVKAPLTESAIRLKIIIGSPFCHPTVVLRRKWLISIKGYGGSFISEDKELWIRAVRNNARMINMPNVLLAYRIHSNQTSRSILGYIDSIVYWFRYIFDYKDFNFLIISIAGFTYSAIKLMLLPVIRLLHKGRFKYRL